MEPRLPGACASACAALTTAAQKSPNITPARLPCPPRSSLPQLAAKQSEGFAVMECSCGTEREGQLRNLYYHVLLRKPLAAS